MGKLSDYEAKYEIVKVTLAEMPVATKTGSLNLWGYTIAVSVMSWAKAPPGIILVFSAVWLFQSSIIYYDVRKKSRARARDRPREPRSSAGGSG